MPAGESPETVAPRVDDLSAVSFATLLGELGITAQRTALAGVQDKVSAAMLNVPVSRRGAACVLKLTPPELPHLVENEAAFLEAARLAGLAVVSSQVVHDRDGRAGLLVERFDRNPTRAVEDGCQVLGLPPADKYRTHVDQLFRALSQVCAAPLPAARALLAQLAFAYLTGNGDAHAKNFSVVQGEYDEWRPSPAYDLPSSQPYDDTTMALPMGNRVRKDLGMKDFLSLGESLGLPEKATRGLLTEQVDRVDAWLPLLDDLPFDVGVRRKLVRVDSYRRDRLR